MSAEPLIRELFRALEATIHERLALVENILNTIEKPKVPLYDHEFIRRIERLEQQIHFLQTVPPHAPIPSSGIDAMERDLLEERITALEEQLAMTCNQVEHLSSLPSHPVVAAVESSPSIILVNEEDVAEPLDTLEEEVVEEEVVEAEEEEVEEVVVEEEGLEVDEFPYKGRMFYKDKADNIYRADDEGEIIPEAIGAWNGKKIVWT